ncbi:hypothetical protein [Ekhidna sp.]|jgi:hypothetical protein|uniref:hypothetical protein n=1 Tax=Ekhidna sp. TaxID=2608089 RepID=UPI0032EF88B6
MNYSLRDLEAEAHGLSSFNGEEAYGQDIEIYTGQDDDMLEFGGSIENFAGERTLNKQFVFTLANSASATRTAVLWAGYLKGNSTLAPGQMADGAFNDTGGNAGLTGSSGVSGKTIAELFAYLEHTPSRVVQMKISSDKQSQIENDLTIEKLNPFRQEQTDYVRSKDYQDQQSFQDKIIIFPTNVQLDNYTKLSYPCVASSSTSITWYFGASVNVSKVLERRAQKAQRNIQLVGADRVIKGSIAQQRALGAGA